MRSQHLPTIAPPPDATERPYWSVMIPTYNSADLLAEALASVLDQDPGPAEMQIEVVDDASCVDVEAVVRRVAGARVSLFRQPHNVGAPANFTTCIERSTGRWVHILHGDDLVLPGFYDAYRNHIEAHRCLMVVGPSEVIGERGEPLRVTRRLESSGGLLVDAAEVLAIQHPVAFSAVVVARTAYEKVGGFDAGLVHANDWEMWTRLAATVPVGYVPVAHTAYRKHARSDTSRLAQSSVYVTDPLAALGIIASRFDRRAVRWRVRYRSRVRLQSLALAESKGQLRSDERGPALRNAMWALRLRPSPQSFANLAAVAGAFVRVRVRRGIPERSPAVDAKGGRSQ